MHTARTRVWSVLESLRKTGSMSNAMTLDRTPAAGWIAFTAGDVRIATWVTTTGGHDGPVVFACLARTPIPEEHS